MTQNGHEVTPGHIVNIGDAYVPDQEFGRIVAGERKPRNLGAVALPVAPPPFEMPPVAPLPEALAATDSLPVGHLASGGQANVQIARSPLWPQN